MQSLTFCKPKNKKILKHEQHGYYFFVFIIAPYASWFTQRQSIVIFLISATFRCPEINGGDVPLVSIRIPNDEALI